MDKKEFTAFNFIPKDFLDISCILERDEKHIQIKLYLIRRMFSRRQILHQECSIDVIEERFRSTTSESSEQETTFFQSQAD